MFVEVKTEKLVGRAFLPTPPRILNRVKNIYTSEQKFKKFCH